MSINSFPKFSLIIISGIVLGILGIAGYIGYKEINTNRSKTQEAEIVSNDEVLNRVSILTEVPYDELPVIATVKDIEKLNDQVFFSRAQNGDKLLIYNKARRAILYRPHSNKIIETMTIKPDSENIAGVQDSIKTDIKTFTLNIYNGTDTPGLASALSTKLESEFEDIKTEILNVGNAKASYEKTLLINNKNIEKEIIERLAQTVDAQIVGLPEGEESSEADIIIFIGRDYTN